MIVFNRYLDLLSELFYRSDHVGIPFEEAKGRIEKYREYEDLTKSQRLSLYENYMDELARRYKEKQKSMEKRLTQEDETSERLGSDDETSDVDAKKNKKKRSKKDKDKEKEKDRKKSRNS